MDVLEGRVGSGVGINLDFERLNFGRVDDTEILAESLADGTQFRRWRVGAKGEHGTRVDKSEGQGSVYKR